ncbi:MAG: PD-(D/E)XK nuclease family protein [Candidatus Zixiibacteriota bacterium]
MGTYSHSRLSTYENCPRKYKFRYVEKFDVGDSVSVESFRGKIVHEALQRLYELVMEGKVWSEADLLTYYDERWQSQHPGSGLLAIKDEHLSEEDFRNKGRRMVQDYYRAYHPFDQEKTVALERTVTVNLDPDGNYKIKGIIDRLAVSKNGVMQIHDYKTARSMVDQRYLDDDRQLALYQLAVQQMWPDRDGFELVWHYLSVPEKRTSSRSDIDIDTLIESTIGLIREVEQATADNNFPTNETRLCNWCEYMSFCPAKIHPLSMEAKSPGELGADEIVVTVDRLAELKRIIASLQNEGEEIKQRLIHLAREKGMTVFAGSDKNASIRFGSRHRPKYSDLVNGKETEKTKFIEFLIKTGMMDQVFSYHSGSFDSFIKRAKFDQKYKEELFDLIESVEQKPVVTVTNKRD